MIDRRFFSLILVLALSFFAWPLSVFGVTQSFEVTVPVSNTCNNDGTCSGQETATNCPNDCSGGNTGGGGPTVYQCNDGSDNDGDGLVDLADPGCSSATDDSEFNVAAVPNVLNFQATYNSNTGNIDLVWQNPSFPEFSGVRVMRMISPNISGGPLEGVLIYDGAGDSIADPNVDFDTTYFYTAFVRNTATPASYSSGAVDSATVPPEDDEGEPTEPTEPSPVDPFEQFPAGNSTSTLVLGDFQFIQDDQPVQFFAGGEIVSVDGVKNLTILLPYNKAPRALKIIGVTVFDPIDANTSFSFILKTNDQKTAYLATIGQLADGDYPFKIHLIDYSDHSIKVLNGTLNVSRSQSALAVFGPVAEVGGDVVLGLGALAGLLHLIFATSKARSFFDVYLLFARFIGSLLGALGLRKKRTPWGTVYDSVTKRPLDPAYVSLLQKGNEVSGAITDIDGRYGFFLSPGVYTLKAGKTHYAFPSTKLAGRSQDELYSDLYFGEEFTTTDGQVINRNIPMDPMEFDWNEFAKTKKDFFQVHSKKTVIRERTFMAIFVAGFLLAIGEMIWLPSLTNLGILAIYLFLLFAQVFWVGKHKVVSLRNLKTGEPLSFAIIKLFLPTIGQEVDPQKDQLIKKVVADELGRFYVLVPPGEYYITVEEKLGDESYSLIYKSELMKLSKGVVPRDIVIS